MKQLIELLIIVFLLTGCNNPSLTADQKNNEKEKIKTRIESYISAYEKKDMKGVISMLSSSSSFLFYGSDVAEKNYNLSDFQVQLEQDWNLFDSIDFGELRNFSIIISDNGDLAVAIYEAPVTLNIRNAVSKITLRMTNTFTKENSVWQLVQGMASIPSVGESSAELIQKMK
jgi:ketosteroid isomerase-like protein